MSAVTSVNIRPVIEESFVLNQFDGYFYPVEHNEATPALVRIMVAVDSYVIERRRREGSSWLPVVVGDAADFDPRSFRAWRRNWPLVQA